MKALSVKQPWASLIASGRKTIETRVWRTDYRGELLICASKRPDIDGLPVGVALAVCRLVDCRPMTDADAEAACCGKYPKACAWVLRDIRPIEPFPVHGRLMLYSVEPPAPLPVSARPHTGNR